MSFNKRLEEFEMYKAIKNNNENGNTIVFGGRGL